MLRKLSAVIYWLLISLCSFSQAGHHYHIDHFTTENGLPSNGIKGLQWDENTGFLWIGTEAGIVRYNGQSFKTFTNDDNPHIGNERILFLARDKTGKLVTADNAGSLFEIDENHLNFLGKDAQNGYPGYLISLLTVSRKMFDRRNQYFYDSKHTQFAKFIPVADTATYFILGGKVFYHSVSAYKPQQQLVSNEQWIDGFRLSDKYFFINDKKNVFHLNSASGGIVPIPIIDKQTDNYLTTDSTSYIWVNGMQKPLLFRGNKAWLLSFTNNRLAADLVCDELPTGMLIRYAWYQPKLKTIVLGTDSKGIYVIRENAVVAMQKQGINDESSSYYTQVALPNGNILTNTGHVIGNNQTVDSQLPISGKFSLNTFKDGDSVLYYVQRNGETNYNCLNRYNFKTQKTNTYSKISFGEQLIMERSGGNLYIVSNKGIARLQNDSLFYLYNFKGGMVAGKFFDMEEISPGVLAIADCNALVRYTVASNILDTLYRSGGCCIRTLWKYKDYLFFGTYGAGFFAYKNGKVSALPLDKNKYLLYTHCFVKDAQNNCWISTNKGLFKVPVADLCEAVDKHAAQLYYYYFGKQDGMITTELNGGCKPCALAMPNGTISFPSMDGLVWVNPAKADVNLPDGKVFIDDIFADTARLQADSLSVNLIPPGTSEIIFRFAFPAWCNRENIYLEYQLNKENTWKPIQIGERTELRFSNLPYGKYHLHIRMPSGFGLNNFTYREIDFTVKTPWFRSTLFYIIVVLLLIAIIVYVFRLRTRHLTEKQQKLQLLIEQKTMELQKKNEVLEKADSVKTRLISIISHDIVTPLKFLTTTSRNMAEKRDLMSDELQQETLDEMMHTSHQLQQLSTNILNWIKYQNENRRLVKEPINLYNLVQAVLRIFIPVAREKEITLRNDIDQQIVIDQFYEPLRIILYNLVSNAINFSEGGVINVSCEMTQNGMTINVQDSGTGMTHEQIKNILASEYIVSSANADNVKSNGLGYLIIKDLLKIIDGTLEIESKKLAGTRVSIKLNIC